MVFRIEVCGGIASGKTTFANLLEAVGTVLYEDFKAVPFWSAYFSAPLEHAFETEVAFLLQHYHQVKQALAAQSGAVICDFSFALDAAYAHVTMKPGHLQAFSAVLEQIRFDLGPPQLIVALACSAEVQLGRVRARGRQSESQIELGFLDRLNHAIEPELSRTWKSVPILAVDSEAEDFAHRQATREHWLQVVLSRVPVEARKGKGHSQVETMR